ARTKVDGVQIVAARRAVAPGEEVPIRRNGGRVGKTKSDSSRLRIPHLQLLPPEQKAVLDRALGPPSMRRPHRPFDHASEGGYRSDAAQPSDCLRALRVEPRQPDSTLVGRGDEEPGVAELVNRTL